jgi:hypothetical protein
MFTRRWKGNKNNFQNCELINQIEWKNTILLSYYCDKWRCYINATKTKNNTLNISLQSPCEFFQLIPLTLFLTSQTSKIYELFFFFCLDEIKEQFYLHQVIILTIPISTKISLIKLMSLLEQGNKFTKNKYNVKGLKYVALITIGCQNQFKTQTLKMCRVIILDHFNQHRLKPE